MVVTESSFAEDWYSVEVTSRSCVGVGTVREAIFEHTFLDALDAYGIDIGKLKPRETFLPELLTLLQHLNAECNCINLASPHY